MRIWIGKEKEGPDRGALTMFIEARLITRRRAEAVMSLAKKHDVSVFYFGAGKKDVLFADKAAFQRFSRENVKIETSYPSRWLARKICPSFTVIVRRDLPAQYNEVRYIPKTESGQFVRIYTNYAENSTKTIQKGLYKGDRRIY